MNANGRRVRQANNGNRHLAKLCGGSYKGGRRMYVSTASSSVAEAIAKARRQAAAENKRKVKVKK